MVENYVRFTKAFLNFSQAKDLGFPTQSFGNDKSEFTRNIAYSLQHSKLFQISKSTRNLLALTKTPKKDNEELKLPFDYSFIDVNFKREDMKQLGIDIGYREIVGIIISKGKMFKQRQKDGKYTGVEYKGDKELTDAVGENIRVTTMSLTGQPDKDDKFFKKDEENMVWFDTINMNVKMFDEELKNFTIKEQTRTHPKARKFIKSFVVNFLNFINNPEIEYIDRKRDDERNKKRAKRGQPPIPDRIIVRLTGHLKKYVDKIEANSGKCWTYGYRFWVRGHFRRQPYKEDGNIKYKRIWILPFVKGGGIMVNTIYKVGKN